MNNEKKEKLMEKYAIGELSLEELNEIAIILQSEPNFQKELDARKDIADSVNIVGNRELRKLLGKFYGEIKPSEVSTSKTIKIKKYLIPISCLVLLGILVYYVTLKGMYSENTIQKNQFAQYYSPSEPDTRSTNIQVKNFLISFNREYLKGNYSEALNIIKPNIEISNNESKLLASIAALETNEIELAMSILDKIIASEDYYYLDHAKWFKALALIQADRKNDAKLLLEKLSGNTQADHYLDAKKLLKKINNQKQ